MQKNCVIYYNRLWVGKNESKVAHPRGTIWNNFRTMCKKNEGFSKIDFELGEDESKVAHPRGSTWNNYRTMWKKVRGF